MGGGHWALWEPAMSIPYRVKIAFLAFVAPSIVCMISLSAPSFGQTRVETGARSAHPRAPTARHHVHKAALIVCDTADVHSCHREFARRHGAQAH